MAKDAAKKKAKAAMHEFANTSIRNGKDFRYAVFTQDLYGIFAVVTCCLYKLVENERFFFFDACL